MSDFKIIGQNCCKSRRANKHRLGAICHPLFWPVAVNIRPGPRGTNKMPCQGTRRNVQGESNRKWIVLQKVADYQPIQLKPTFCVQIWIGIDVTVNWVPRRPQKTHPSLCIVQSAFSIHKTYPCLLQSETWNDSEELLLKRVVMLWVCVALLDTVAIMQETWWIGLDKCRALKRSLLNVRGGLWS